MAGEFHKKTVYAGPYSKDFNEELYLLFEAEISEEQYNVIKENINVVFPDGQVVTKDGKFYVKADQEATNVIEFVKEALAEKGIEWPTA